MTETGVDHDPVAVMRAHWGAEAPDWVVALAMECASSSQAKVARAMGRSAALVSTVLRRKYVGSYEAVEEVFNGVFKGAVTGCPALGTIPLNVCRDWRLKLRGEYIPTNRERVGMYRACSRCPQNMKGGAQ